MDFAELRAFFGAAGQKWQKRGTATRPIPPLPGGQYHSGRRGGWLQSISQISKVGQIRLVFILGSFTHRWSCLEGGSGSEFSLTVIFKHVNQYCHPIATDQMGNIFWLLGWFFNLCVPQQICFPPFCVLVFSTNFFGVYWCAVWA